MRFYLGSAHDLGWPYSADHRQSWLGKDHHGRRPHRARYAAVDADDEIAAWECRPDGRRWVWDRHQLERVIQHRAPGPLFVCGIALNQRDMLDLFDHVFLLSLDEDTQVERLTTSGDREPVLWKPIIDGLPVFESEMKAVDAKVLDGRLPTSVLAAQIVRHVSLRSGP